jgi:hypothetical protein
MGEGACEDELRRSALAYLRCQQYPVLRERKANRVLRKAVFDEGVVGRKIWCVEEV